MNSKAKALTIWFSLLALICGLALLYVFVPNFGMLPPVLLPLRTSQYPGQSVDELLSEFGPPDHESAYTMAECVGELRVTLFNTYSPDRSDLADIEIRELSWDYPNNIFTVWLHRPRGEWTVLETFRYETEAVF